MKRRAAATIAILLAFVTVQGCRGAAEREEKAVKEEETLVTPGQPGKNITSEAVIDRIVEEAPTRLSNLEKILGGLQRDPKKDFMQLRREIGSGGVGAVVVDYAVDIYHHDPREVEDPDLARYSIAEENLKPTDLHWPASMVWKAEGCRIDFIEAVALEPAPHE
jgi:hypothetical protein